MKITINSVLEGEDVVKFFLEYLANNNVKADGKDIKILIKSKEGKDVEVGADRLRLVFNRE